MKRIKRSVTEKEYKKLMLSITRNKTIRENTKMNYLRAITILFYTGVRLNEVQEFRIKHIVELYQEGVTVLITPKTKSEREIFASDDFKNELKKLFDFNPNMILDQRIITKGSDKNKMTGINNQELIRQINTIMREVLGEGYTSHSFRQGLLTEMASKGVNLSIIRDFVGHKSTQTTAGYVKATADDIKRNLAR